MQSTTPTTPLTELRAPAAPDEVAASRPLSEESLPPLSRDELKQRIDLLVLGTKLLLQHGEMTERDLGRHVHQAAAARGLVDADYGTAAADVGRLQYIVMRDLDLANEFGLHATYYRLKARPLGTDAAEDVRKLEQLKGECEKTLAAELGRGPIEKDRFWKRVEELVKDNELVKNDPLLDSYAQARVTGHVIGALGFRFKIVEPAPRLRGVPWGEF